MNVGYATFVVATGADVTKTNGCVLLMDVNYFLFPLLFFSFDESLYIYVFICNRILDRFFCCLFCVLQFFAPVKWKFGFEESQRKKRRQI